MPMNKTDNLELMARPADTGPEQLTLPLPVKSEKPMTELEKKQRANFEAVCADCRNDAAIYLAVVQARYPEVGYANLRDVTIAHLQECQAEYEAHPFRTRGTRTVPYPEIEIDYVAWGNELFQHREPVKPKAYREYKPWSWERRVQTAARKVRERFTKKYSFGELWIDKAQAKILEDPWRYGCCPLPSEGSCLIPDPDRIISRANAIATELHLRQVERGEVEALKISLELKTPAYAEEFRSDQ